MCESRHYQPTVLFYERDELLPTGVEESKGDCLLSRSFEHISKEELEKEKEEKGLEETILESWTQPIFHDFVVVSRRQVKPQPKLVSFKAKESAESCDSSSRQVLCEGQRPLDLLTGDFDVDSKAKGYGKSIVEEFDPLFNPQREKPSKGGSVKNSLNFFSAKGGVEPHRGPSSALLYKIKVRCEEEDSGWLGLDLRYTYLGELICDRLPRHPLNQRKLPVERSGKVRVGDRLVRVNNVSLEAAPSVEAAMTVVYSHLAGQNASNFIVLEFESATLTVPTWICPICTYVNSDFQVIQNKMEGVELNFLELSCSKCNFVYTPRHRKAS